VVLRLFSPDEGDDEGRRKLKLDSEPVAQISDVSDLSDHCCCREVGVLFLRGFVGFLLSLQAKRSKCKKRFPSGQRIFLRRASCGFCCQSFSHSWGSVFMRLARDSFVVPLSTSSFPVACLANRRILKLPLKERRQKKLNRLKSGRSSFL
jgi:hypothetical protein